ncbi:MAG: hypothetical protein ACJASQ_002913 [Crocinitomicaceae bacterium]|jgi:hypothetical protein
MSLDLSIQIHKDQLDKVLFGDANKTSSPDLNSSSIEMSLKVAINRTMNSRKLSTIVFQTKNRGIFHVKSSILMQGTDYIVLKGGKSIPVKSIIKVIP